MKRQTTKVPTVAQIRAKVRLLGIEVIDDEEAGCYRATAPLGHTLDGDLHEYVANYWNPGLPIEAAEKREARDDLSSRLEGVEPEPCDNLECDWCEEDRS